MLDVYPLIKYKVRFKHSKASRPGIQQVLDFSFVCPTVSEVRKYSAFSGFGLSRQRE